MQFLKFVQGFAGIIFAFVIVLGSGKTLAFALPIILEVLRLKRLRRHQDKNYLIAVILEPTKELAKQVGLIFLLFFIKSLKLFFKKALTLVTLFRRLGPNLCVHAVILYLEENFFFLVLRSFLQVYVQFLKFVQGFPVKCAVLEDNSIFDDGNSDFSGIKFLSYHLLHLSF